MRLKPLRHKSPTPSNTAPVIPQPQARYPPQPNHSLSTWLSGKSKAQHPPRSCLSSITNPHTLSPKIPPPKHMHPASITLLSSFMPPTHQNTVPYPPHKYPAPNSLQHTVPYSIIHQSSPLPRYHPPKPNIFQYHKPQLSRYYASPVRYFLHSLVQSRYAKLF